MRLEPLTCANLTIRPSSVNRRFNPWSDEVPVVTPGITPAIAARIAGLSPRELMVLTLAATGMPNKTIAEQLGVGRPTVKFHLHNIYGKLGVANRTEATRVAIERGLVEHPLSAAPQYRPR